MRSRSITCDRCLVWVTPFVLLCASSWFGPSSSQAFPDGAGGCAGRSSLGLPHTSPDEDPNVVARHNLTDKGLMVATETRNQPSRELFTTSINTLYTAVSYDLTLQANERVQDAEFRGFLFRLTDPLGFDTTPMLAVVDNVISQAAEACTILEIGGVTHITNDPKTEVKALIRVNRPCNLTLEVTAVFRNRWESSVVSSNPNGTWFSDYAFSTFELTFAEAPFVSRTPTQAPTGSIVTSEGVRLCGWSSCALVVLSMLTMVYF